jgi:hypothetical protein
MLLSPEEEGMGYGIPIGEWKIGEVAAKCKHHIQCANENR